ncbi:MAG: DUF58 domain-containing protein [Sedimenticola sp.]|nr:MAG: DUF58 domain-containing protein [Sedimenticola sp.]
MSQSRRQGIDVSVEELRQVRREAHRLGVAPADAVASFFPGVYRALFHGRGIEFDEVRNYQWGDDYRAVDWRVTARTGQMHTKLFHEERERTLYLLVDAGASMQFGSRVRFKWVQAARIAALFSWLAVENGDRIAGAVFGAGPRVVWQRPTAGETAALRLFHLLAGVSLPPDGGPSTLAEALLQLRQLIKPGSLILLLSYFAALGAEVSRHLAHLQQHNDLAAVQLFDPLERALPDSGQYPITDGTSQALLDCSDGVLRHAYTWRFDDQTAQLKSLFLRYGAKLISIAADADLVDGLRLALMPARFRSPAWRPRRLGERDRDG